MADQDTKQTAFTKRIKLTPTEAQYALIAKAADRAGLTISAYALVMATGDTTLRARRSATVNDKAIAKVCHYLRDLCLCHLSAKSEADHAALIERHQEALRMLYAACGRGADE